MIYAQCVQSNEIEGEPAVGQAGAGVGRGRDVLMSEVLDVASEQIESQARGAVGALKVSRKVFLDWPQFYRTLVVPWSDHLPLITDLQLTSGPQRHRRSGRQRPH